MGISKKVCNEDRLRQMVLHCYRVQCMDYRIVPLYVLAAWYAEKMRTNRYTVR